MPISGAAALISMVLTAGAELSAANVPGAASTEPAPAPSSSWPLRATLHPLAAALRTAALAEFAAQARALPPEDRVKALHDWVALSLRYSLDAHDRQRPEDVLARRTATCDGYSSLFKAAAEAAGLEVEVVRGLFKSAEGPPQPHAWNAVKLGTRWWLVDVTLDDPTLRGAGSKDDGFRTDYLLIPADVAALDHWPFEPRWQLEAPRPSREAFSAASRTSAPSLVRSGISILEGPRRKAGELSVRLKTQGDRYLFLALGGVPCGPPQLGPTLELRCRTPDSGQPRLELLEHAQDTGLFLSIFEFSPGW